MGKRLVYAAQSNRDSSPLSIGELACAGAFSAVPATLVAGPAERVKVLLQVRPYLHFHGKRRKVGDG
jgi:solute carrier family 25 carnitine/acylcarnitine transporter 20/29